MPDPGPSLLVDLRAWSYDLELKASEDPRVGYGDQWDTAFRAACVTIVLLLLLALLALSVFHSAYAAAMSRSRGDHPGPSRPTTVGGLWREARPQVGPVFRTHLRAVVCACGPALAGFVLFVAVDADSVPGVEPSRLSGTTSVAYPLVGWCLPIALASLTLLLGFRFSLAPAAVVATGSSPKDALRRSWDLTRRSRWLTSGVCLLLTAAGAAVFTALRLALTPLADPARLAMLDLADGNRYAADAIGTLMPSASALLLLPLIVLPPVCSALAVVHAGLSEASGCPGRPGGPDGRRPPCPAPP
ncbi:hypothetical protein HRW23_10735 [Streptomyces lunaelactis]|uniref:hypothetical protein n=1 Tax=Streptomyces lunaelactis TaxID=1535768 RepID=UPI0015853051|nr:hypothetical protein [Streptomyces lunaelactis]NUK24915.1 hypothetical protein [Streptomyces lunaelactis]NUK52755.1 hypothetical protein [Streptomyces lunaelactis]NUK60032.1 hypothetical protein [Streptomyces lunaelactis]NUK66564.1 hypothetical protein [Streptomyces lunaelactis]NUK77868.1 hypothetical protein [Streptomyces lunaelactis]